MSELQHAATHLLNHTHAHSGKVPPRLFLRLHPRVCAVLLPLPSTALLPLPSTALPLIVAANAADRTQVNHRAIKHADANNISPSYIQRTGEHTGGALWTADQDALDCHGRWRLFDGNKGGARD